VRERGGQRQDVGPGRVAHLSHRVDERDLGGEEAVRRCLHQLGRGQVGDHLGHPARQRVGVHRAQHIEVLLVTDAEDEPIRVQRVLHRAALAQELRVPGEVDVVARGSAAAQHRGDLGGGAHRHRGLAHHQARSPQVRGQRGSSGVHRSKVGTQPVTTLRGADAEKVDVGGSGLGDVGAEPQPPVLDVLADQRFEVGLEERQPALGERADLGRIGVHADHPETEVGHAGGMGRAEIPGADDADRAHGAHGVLPSSRAADASRPDRPAGPGWNVSLGTGYTARRPENARPRVSSSANSRSPPIGNPEASRVTARSGKSRSIRTR
jgi:hypothetical protein